MACATSSLPVPLSPVMSTLALVGAHLLDDVEDLLHRRTRADDVVEAEVLFEARAKLGGLVAQGAALERTAEDEHELVDLERLGEVVLAPSCMARTAVSTSANAVMRTTMSSGSASRARRRARCRPLQQPPGQALLFLQHAQQQVLRPHVLVVELGALLGGVLEDPLDLLLHGDVDAGAAGRGLLVPGAQGRDQALAQQVGLDPHAVQQLDGGLLRLPQQPQEQVAALDAFGTELARLIAGEEHDATGFFSELFEHGSPPGKGPPPLPLLGPG